MSALIEEGLVLGARMAIPITPVVLTLPCHEGGVVWAGMWVCHEKNCPPENFCPRTKKFNISVEIFCPLL